MRIAVVTGGPLSDGASVIISAADSVYCADSGLDFCIRSGIRPDIVYGDLDSVSAEGMEYVRAKNIPLKRYSSHKDMTDTDIALEDCPSDSEVILVCSLTGRIDHVVTNLGLLVKYKKRGLDITATDGITDIIPLIGEDSITVEGLESGGLAVSLIPFAADRVEGVTTENLLYPLKDATVEAAGSLYVSNELVEGCDSFAVSVKCGNLLVTISPSL